MSLQYLSVGFCPPEFRIKAKESKIYPQRYIAVCVYKNTGITYKHIHIDKSEHSYLERRRMNMGKEVKSKES